MLGGWSPHVQTGFHVSRPTQKGLHFTATGLSPTMAQLSRCFALFQTRPGPRSLAATKGVSIDVLSSGYLDGFNSPSSLFNTYVFSVKYLTIEM